MEPTELNEDGLLLRPWRAADADAVHRACQDPDIRRWTTVPSPYLLEHAIGFVGTIAPQSWAAGTGAPFAVCDAGTGELLASCGLVGIDHGLRSAEVGYWTAPWARGRGVAVRATRAVARWAFESLGIRRVIWQAELGNHASRLVALRAGFRVEGQLRLADPNPAGTGDGWIGSLLPGDLDRDTSALAGPGTLAARRAAVFGRPQPVLAGKARGGEIRLRRPEERDVESLVTTCRDPETVRWTGVPHPYQRSDAEFFTGPYARGRWDRGDGAVFVLADAADAAVGAMELRISPADPTLADIAFVVAPAARGLGYASAGLRTLCIWGFAALDLARVEWEAYVGNTASRRVAEQAGFVPEGVRRAGAWQRGEPRDVWTAGLLPSDLSVDRADA
ncbi:GNAT family N-acetyltransferase [Micromonospora sp. NPDC049559]|uniref:GNAT family N-acetyltransferase n=1 Tax=Micromonospora sp. NPDC049559 TaxID=3155923 RepID=UPI0034310923